MPNDVRRLICLDVVGSIVRDMERAMPGRQLRCKVCGRVQPNDWSHLRTGWPKCCGETMLLEAHDAG